MAGDASFDPYRKWLGIPPSEQPPNYYRLLGIPLFEGDPDVIINAADRQIGHVRRFQAGQYAEICQRVLSELTTARLCLLDPVRKRDYDQKLFFELQARGIPLPLPVATPLSPEAPFANTSAAPGISRPDAPPVGQPPGEGLRIVASPENLPVSVLLRRKRRSAWKDPTVTVLLLAAFLAVLVLTLLIIFRQDLMGP